jgi:hypothetical protein
MAASNRSRKAKARVSKTRQTLPPNAEADAATARFRLRLLDARPDRLDFRDLPYRPPLRSLAPVWPSDETIGRNMRAYIEAGLIRNQGQQGACTGFGLACVANYLLFVRHLNSGGRARFVSVSPRMFYELARRYDEWPGVDYDGSSCRGALKGWHKHGVCTEALWPYELGDDDKPIFAPPQRGWELDAASRPLGVYYRVDKSSVVDLQAALNDIGAVYVSANAHDGWDRLLSTRKGPIPTSHASLPLIGPARDPKAWGGHSFALVGYNERGFVVQNSWGEVWGARGFAVLPYADWVEHSTDAWVCALGAPVEISKTREQLSRYRVRSGQPLGSQAPAARNPHNPNDDPWPFDHDFNFAAYEPWSTADAYDHTLVSGNDGVLLVPDVTFGVGADPEPYAQKIVVDEPCKWFRQQPARKPAKLMVYAHGGLNSEDASIQRIRVLAPYCAANGIYPLFLTWKTGPIETLLDIFDDLFKGEPTVGPAGGIADDIREGKDRLIEATSHITLRGVWSEMRGNAENATQSGRAIDLLAKKLIALREALKADNRELEVHLVGHSAGSIMHGWLIDRLLRDDLSPSALKIESCTLFAPACSVQFAIGTYAKAQRSTTDVFRLRDLYIHYLTDANEKKDGLPNEHVRVYGKSLLYLVSRALHDDRKMPILGLQNALEPSRFDERQWAENQVASVKAWQAVWKPDTAHGFALADASVRTTRTGMAIQSTHGSFDNSIDALTATLERVKESALVKPMEWLDY